MKEQSCVCVCVHCDQCKLILIQLLVLYTSHKTGLIVGSRLTFWLCVCVCGGGCFLMFLCVWVWWGPGLDLDHVQFMCQMLHIANQEEKQSNFERFVVAPVC